MKPILSGPIPAFRRDLEITQIDYQGQPMLLLNDALGLQPESVLVSPLVVFVASVFDGKKTARDVRSDLARHKVILSEEEVQSVADQLEKKGFLETEAAAAQRLHLLDEFRRSPVRKWAAGARGLPENPLEFAALLGRFSQDPKGPGEPAPPGADGLPPLGLVSPHIDFFRGGPTYAWAYQELAKRRPPDVIVALGVAHLAPNSPWVMTKKSYETPYGPMEVDEALYEEIRGELWYDPLEEEWVHAKEHSLEFQALWLKHIWRRETPRWVPLLCSGFHRFCTDSPPSSVPTIEGAVRSIGRILSQKARQGRRVMVLAGVDFAHVGRRFGDAQDVTADLRSKIEALDRASLEQALRLEADPFFLSGIGDGAWRKVCGLSALYTALRWIQDLSNGNDVSGRLLSYDQAEDPAGGIVSFASAVFDGGPTQKK
ncbi:MAG: AmmeMemoRadiSam system protein B [Elusimicrobia bacterium]|nr:AmmeMemoRadiSam system protein B [Elusimicrobiota bacterium]